MIKPLSEDLRNKISAGEVVERPASAVKELVENSLDAGANEIVIVVESGGQRLIQITDNGCGIPADELQRAVERYTTSKIENIDDLFNIETLGFRGEALASIASVSELDIISSVNGEEGAEINCRNGIASSIKPAPGIKGTQITVQNLFYNTPARRKFLKSPRVELRQIVMMVKRLALAYPDVALTLIADQKNIISLTPESLEDRIVSLFDPTYRDQLLPIHVEKGDYAFSGYIGNLNLIRTRPGEQYVFLNRRYIKDRLLNSAVYSGYQSLTRRGEYPFFVLNLSVPTDQVDVNVHPMKTEVRFKDEWRLYHVLKSGVTDSLTDILDTIPFFERPVSFNESPSSDSQTLTGKQTGMFFDRNIPSPTQPPKHLERAKSYASKLAERQEAPGLIDMGNIWQVHSKYIVSQVSSGLVIIDQHVAHERILFEEAMNAFDKTPMPSQTLLFPVNLQFSPDEYSTLLDVLPYLEKIGFKMKEAGDRAVNITAIPSDMGWGNERRVIKDILDYYLSHQKEYSSLQENLAASFACKAAIKAGDSLTVEEMQTMVNRLFATKHPYYCPHGRPIIVRLTLDELDKRFERS